MTNRLYLAYCFLFYFSVGVIAQTTPVYDLEILDTGIFDSRANTVNEEGLIGGSRIIQETPNAIDPAESYLWLDGAIIWSGHLGGASSGVASVNNNGIAIGQAKLAGAPFNGLNCGFQVDIVDQDMQPLLPLSVFDYNSVNYAYSLNDQGDIVGNSRIYDEELGEDPYNAYHAVRWDQAGNVLDLGTLGAGYSRAFAINENNEAAGAAIPMNEDILHAVRWTIGTDESVTIEDIHNIPNSNFSDVIDMNNEGTILGEALIGGETTRVVIWDSANNSTVLELADGANCFAGAINNQGDIVGFCEILTPSNNRINKAFLYQNEHFYFLEDIVDNLEPTRRFESAYDINDQGWIVGSSTILIGNEEKKQSYFIKPQENPVAVTDLSSSPFNTITLSPNPNSGQPITLNIHAKAPTMASILVYDGLGRRMATISQQQELKLGKNIINWQPQPNLSNGTYRIVIVSENGPVSIPFQLTK